MFKSTNAMAIEFGWQLLGGKEWHQTCKYPRMGVGFQYMHVANRDELGHPFSIYGFYDGNYFRTKNFELTNRMAVGFAYGFKTYDPADETSNDLFSTRLNSFQELGVGMAIRLYRSVYIEPGFRLTHYSNGNMKEPQKGLNIPSYNLSLRSVLGNSPPEPVRVPLDDYFPRHQTLAFFSMSPRQYDFIDDSTRYHETYGMNFLMANLHLGYYYALTRRFRLGAGVDFIYDGTNGIREASLSVGGMPLRNAVPFHDRAGVALYAGGEKDIDRLCVVAGLGYIVAQTRFGSSTPRFEQRLGFKYHIYPNVFAGANVRSYNFRAAKAVEFNVGVRRFWH